MTADLPARGRRNRRALVGLPSPRSATRRGDVHVDVIDPASYRRPMSLPTTLPDQPGRTWLVTGATNGLGREVARGEWTRRELGAASVIDVDLASQASVREATARVQEPIDVLVDNAGTITARRVESIDGHELVFATNVLGPFALTNRLVDRLRGRIVIVGSGAHKRSRIDFTDPHFRRRRWSVSAAYGQSKLADMLWALALQQKLTDRHHPATVQLAHPGWALTNLQNATGHARLDDAITAACRPFAQPADTAAASILVAATADLPPVSYIGPGGLGGLRGAPAHASRSPAARDRSLAAAVWRLAAEETGTDL